MLKALSSLRHTRVSQLSAKFRATQLAPVLEVQARVFSKRNFSTEASSTYKYSSQLPDFDVSSILSKSPVLKTTVTVSEDQAKDRHPLEYAA